MPVSPTSFQVEPAVFPAVRMRPLVHLLGLRYRLLWAQARSGAGKAAFVALGVLLVCLVAAVLALGGLGAAVAAVRLGKGESIAGVMLSAFFMFALFGALILGAGINPAFSDAALRRYPLSRLDRAGARELTAFLEPVWLFVLAIDLGEAVGFHAFWGASSLWLAVLAAFLLAVTNFLLARIVSVLADWVASRRVGPLLLARLFSLGIAAPPMFHNLPAAPR